MRSVSGVSGGADVWDGSIDTEWDGSGTASDPYLITSAAELAGLAERVNNGETFAGKYFELTTDIDLNNLEWTPIGTADRHRFTGSYSNLKSFAGVFDGDGHTVSGMLINTESWDWYAKSYGLFGCVSGTIVDLNMDNSRINVNGGAAVSGTLVGLLNEGSVQNCSVTNSIIEFQDDGEFGSFLFGYIAGGVVGENIDGTVVAYVNELTNDLPDLDESLFLDSFTDPIVGKGGTGAVTPDDPVLPTSYTLIASVVGGHGNITHSGNTSITPGKSFTYTFIPDAGYAVDTVLVDNVDDTVVAENVTAQCVTVLGYTMNYTIPNIMNNYTISVSFKLSPTYTITIPSYLNISNETNYGVMEVIASNLWIPENEYVSVTVESAGDFNLTHTEVTSAKLPYNLFIDDSGVRISNNMEVANFTVTEYLEKQTQSLKPTRTLNGTVTETAPFVGTYNDILTFTIEWISA